MTPIAVLVVDDDEDVRVLLRIILEGCGYRVACASDGVEALQRLRDHSPPSLVVLDLMMPRLSGAELLDIMRADPDLRGIPVLILSGRVAAGETAIAHGASGLLLKPVELDQLIEAVRRHTSSA